MAAHLLVIALSAIPSSLNPFNGNEINVLALSCVIMTAYQCVCLSFSVSGLPALCTHFNPLRHTATETSWLCRHYWYHHWPALDSSELYHHYGVPDNSGNSRRGHADCPRYGGRIFRLLHGSRVGAWRGLWHQRHHGYRGRRERTDHTHKTNTTWWFNTFTPIKGEGLGNRDERERKWHQIIKPSLYKAICYRYVSYNSSSRVNITQ